MDFLKWITRLGTEIIPLEINYFQAGASSGTNKHVHPGQLHIACFEKGGGSCLINGVLHKIRPGDICIVLPGEIHQFIIQPENPYLACFLHFSWFGELPSELPQKLKVPRRERRKFFNLCRKLSTEISHGNDEPGKEFFFHGDLLHFWGLLFCYAKGEVSPGPPKVGINKQLNPVIEKLHGPPFFYPGIDALAEESGLSRRSLTKMFKDNLGCSIKQYFLSNVMHYAHTIRQKRAMSTASLARQCGYSSAQNFLLAYKKYFSRNPLEISGENRIWRGKKWYSEKQSVPPEVSAGEND